MALDFVQSPHGYTSWFLMFAFHVNCVTQDHILRFHVKIRLCLVLYMLFLFWVNRFVFRDNFISKYCIKCSLSYIYAHYSLGWIKMCTFVDQKLSWAQPGPGLLEQKYVFALLAMNMLNLTKHAIFMNLSCSLAFDVPFHNLFSIPS